MQHLVNNDDDIPEDGYEMIEMQDRKSRIIGRMVDRMEK